MRQDKKRENHNERVRSAMKNALRAAKRNPTAKHIQEAFSILDTAAKKRVIHPNKAARLKSRLSKKKSKILKSQPKASRPRDKKVKSDAVVPSNEMTKDPQRDLETRSTSSGP